MNSHIYEFCFNYINTENNPEYAVLIKGPWGSGKTWFIKKMQNKLINDNLIEEDDIIYISLFGVSSIEEIELELFKVIHPILSSPQFRLAGAVLKQAVKFGVNIDLNSDGKSEGSLSFNSDINSNNKIKIEKLEKKILIIDDIERSDLPPSKLLGYFSSFIVDQGIRIIFVGNEKEYKKKYKDLIHAYDLVREKIIGHTFKITPDYDNAIDLFIKDYNWCNEIVNLKEMLNNILSILNIKNLRIIKQAFQGISYLFKVLPKKINDKEYLSKVIEIYFLLFIQNANGDLINRNDTKEAIVAYYKYQKDLKNYIKLKEEKKNSVFMSIFSGKIPLNQCWEEIIFDGKYSKDNIKNNLEKDFELNNPESQSNLYYLLNNWRDMNKDDFEKKVKKLIEEFNDGKYLRPGDILHVSNILFLYSKWDIIPWSLDKLKEDISKIIDKYSSEIEILRDFYEINTAYAGWGYNYEIHELKEIKNKLYEINNINLRKKFKDELNDYVENLVKDFDEFIYNIYLANGSGKYIDIPILSFIDINKLYKELKKIDKTKQNSFIYALEERYEKKYSNGNFKEKYHDDYKNLILLRDKYKEEMKKDKMFNPLYVHYDKLTKRYDELIKYMEKFM